MWKRDQSEMKMNSTKNWTLWNIEFGKNVKANTFTFSINFAKEFIIKLFSEKLDEFWVFFDLITPLRSCVVIKRFAHISWFYRRVNIKMVITNFLGSSWWSETAAFGYWNKQIQGCLCHFYPTLNNNVKSNSGTAISCNKWNYFLRTLLICVRGNVTCEWKKSSKKFSNRMTTRISLY